MECKDKRSEGILIIAFLIFLSCFFDKSVKVQANSINNTHSPEFQNAVILHGIDVSDYQRNINWDAVKAAGVDFVIISAGFRGYGGSGSYNVDPKFHENIKAAKERGIDVGAYFFSQAISEEEALAEAKYFLSLVKGYEFELPLVMNFEYASNSNGNIGRLYEAKAFGKLTRQVATRIVSAFCGTIEDNGYTAMLYANKSMLEDDLYAEQISEKYPIWLANYATMTGYKGEYSYWQYTETGSMKGISGNVDLNYRYVMKPNVVQGMKAEAITSSSIEVSWNKVPGVYGYEVYGFNSQSGQYELITSIKGASSTRYIAENIDTRGVYRYKVRAYTIASTLEEHNVYGEFSKEATWVGVQGVSLNTTSTTMRTIGDTITLTATISPANATNKTLVWTSSDKAVASVNENGIVTAMKNGTAVITVTTEDWALYASCKITVENNESPSISAQSREVIQGMDFNPLEAVSATDPEDGDITSKVTASGTVDTSKPGRYTVNYSVTDSQGASAATAISIIVTKSDWYSHWGFSAIKQGMEKGIVDVSEKFRPEDSITRAEFIKLVNKTFGYTQAGNISFKDVKSASWFYNDIKIAAKAGYISTANDTFRPDAPITREEVAVIIANLMKIHDNNFDKLSGYSDKNKVSPWAKSAVEGVIELGYMGKGSAEFRPQAKMVRAEAITALSRIK